MQALMLAAGMGKRLGRYTKNATKCMVPVKYNDPQFLEGRQPQKIEESKLAERVQIEGKDILVKSQTIYGDLKQNHLWKKL